LGRRPERKENILDKSGQDYIAATTRLPGGPGSRMGLVKEPSGPWGLG